MYIKNSNLLTLLFAIAFLARIFHALGLPAVFNFLHLAVVPFACGLALFTKRSKNLQQISNSNSILFGLVILLTVIVASALLNSAGVVNILCEFLLLSEPFIFLLTIISIPMSTEAIQSFRTWIFRFAIANIFFSHRQKFAWHLDRVGVGYDNIKGVFIAQGAGHYVGAAVALTFGVFYMITAKHQPMTIRVVMFIASVSHVVISGRRQVFLAFILALLLSSIINLKDIKKALVYLIATFAAAIFMCLAAYTVLPSLLVWLRPEIVGDVIHLKNAGFRIIPMYYHSPLNILLGIGPGHSFGRLGGWMLRDYHWLLGPLGATSSPASNEVWTAVSQSLFGDKSTFFSPLFSWAGIWGDLGFLGLGAYFYLASSVWRRLCLDGSSKYLMLTALLFGYFFTWLEEPGYMLLLASFIGIQWHIAQIPLHSTFKSSEMQQLHSLSN